MSKTSLGYLSYFGSVFGLNKAALNFCTTLGNANLSTLTLELGRGTGKQTKARVRNL